MKKVNTLPQKKSSDFPFILPIKNSTLCNNKEFFYTPTKHIKSELEIIQTKTISEEEYENAVTCIINMDTVYFSLTKTEKNIYNQNIKIIKDFLTQTK
ncbi:MAG: hypothetical protein J6J27_01430 [Alphaproteobacteria bacterium]|nr:hypothetical protein [Alphaproteobacteria bacterium]